MADYRTPYNLQPSDSCEHCAAPGSGFFCQLPPETLQALEQISFVTSYPAGALLFVEEQSPRGVYIICRGEAKLSVVSQDGRTLILKIAGPGEVLGLSACVMNKPYEASVETLSPCQVNFIKMDDFLRLIREDSEACMRAAVQISRQYNNACRELRWVGLSRSADWKVASMLLGWGEEHQNGHVTGAAPVFKMTLTHEEIAQMIGTTRETVTRVLARFRKQKLIDVRGATMVLSNQAALLDIAGRGSMANVPPMPVGSKAYRQTGGGNVNFRGPRDKSAALAAV
ncbi:MAG: Crp/Fnr family transcriptional regulator [Terriglobales bacterium]